MDYPIYCIHFCKIWYPIYCIHFCKNLACKFSEGLRNSKKGGCFSCFRFICVCLRRWNQEK